MRVFRVILVPLAALIAAVALALPAGAAAYTKNAYAPARAGNTITGWADLSLDCSGTYGCWNFIKIERQRWYGPEYVSGKWASSNGWNSISAALSPGCYNYRTHVDSYNDTVGSIGAGVNIGPVGISSEGTTVSNCQYLWIKIF